MTHVYFKNKFIYLFYIIYIPNSQLSTAMDTKGMEDLKYA